MLFLRRERHYTSTMGEAKHDGLAVPGHVVLAHEPPFTLGLLSVDPATRQVEALGRRETLEPRIMQVLVALAHANGAIVTRNELIERCWDGRIVTDDAINRVLSRIRQVAADIGRGSFTVETIARVGYRLIAEGESATQELVPHQSASISRRNVLVSTAGTVAVAGAGFGLWRFIRSRHKPSAEALALYHKGIEARDQGWFEIFDQAEDWFRQAVDADPSFAAAWGALALQLAMELEAGDESRLAASAAECGSAAHRALSLDRNQRDARAALALLPNRFRNWGVAEQKMRAAYREQPDNWLLASELGWLLGHVGRFDDAIPLLERSARASPLVSFPRTLLSYAYLATDRIEEALTTSSQTFARWPHNNGTWLMRLDVLNQCGKYDAARGFASDQSQGPSRKAPLVRLFMSATSALASRSAGEIEALRETAVEAANAQERQAAPAALMMAGVGQADAAFDFLDAYFFRRGPFATNSRKPMSPLLRRDTDFLFFPLMRPLWHDSRFDHLTDAIGLNAYWRSIGFTPPHRR